MISGLLLGAGAWAFSQTQTTGRITGTVKDPQGAVIPGAEVVVENPTTAERYSAATDSSGSYSIPQLPPARYDVTIHASGFTPAEFREVAIGLAETIPLN